MAALSDIDNTSSEDPSSDEDEPDKKDKKMKDFNDLCLWPTASKAAMNLTYLRVEMLTDCRRRVIEGRAGSLMPRIREAG
ncbi:hypothetical protein GUJ93_ZPchr0015g6795 [Zizania palustris]|uniref:Uncharacterized protein n=1 Tax=Zizania palustris TaxID=103762 RepID=A0A8J5W659_ZIZPA|nr:hypothetical protein GUJ93_ZPchr0015g6795 [Zizania palustris]